MKSIHVHTTNTITSLSPPRACSFSAPSHLLCFAESSLPPFAAPVGTIAPTTVGPTTSKALDEGHFAQMRIHEEWTTQERERRWWQEWQDSWAWDWTENRWTWADWSGGQWKWKGRHGWSWEPTRQSPQNEASSSWEEDKDPATVSVEAVHENMGTHRLKAITPVSFQPQRHITMILGRPVMVPRWATRSKGHFMTNGHPFFSHNNRSAHSIRLMSDLLVKVSFHIFVGDPVRCDSSFPWDHGGLAMLGMRLMVARTSLQARFLQTSNAF